MLGIDVFNLRDVNRFVKDVRYAALLTKQHIRFRRSQSFVVLFVIVRTVTDFAQVFYIRGLGKVFLIDTAGLRRVCKNGAGGMMAR